MEDFQNPQLNSLYNQLPKDKEVLIDLSNYKGQGVLFYESCKTFYDKNPKVKWINCSAEEKEQFIEAGIKATSIQ